MESKIVGTVMPVLELHQESVGFNITTAPGIQNAFFGGSGHFLAALQRSGRVWLQSMSMHHLAHAIQE